MAQATLYQWKQRFLVGTGGWIHGLL